MMDLLLSNFIIRSLIAGALLAPSLALMGCFLMWRRMAFLSDTLSHGAVLGVALGLFLQMEVHLSVLVVSLFIALILSLRRQSHFLPPETWMSITSYGSLALGLILLTFNRQNRVDPDSILFGDILGTSPMDMIWLLGIGVFVAGMCYLNWRQWLLLTLDEDLAQTSGVPVTRHRMLFIGVIALVIAIGMKIIGALLLPALLILPAATVSRISKTPEQMVLLSIAFLLICYFLGFYLSFEFDSPTGPTIVVVSTLVFLGCVGATGLRRRI
jgi:zinc transport system permease protein